MSRGPLPLHAPEIFKGMTLDQRVFGCRNPHRLNCHRGEARKRSEKRAIPLGFGRSRSPKPS